MARKKVSSNDAMNLFSSSKKKDEMEVAERVTERIVENQPIIYKRFTREVISPENFIIPTEGLREAIKEGFDGIKPQAQAVSSGLNESSARKAFKQAIDSTNGFESRVNSSMVALGSGETFTGSWELNNYANVMVSCQCDNTGTLNFDFSVDGVNVTTFPSQGFKVASGIHEFHTAVKGPRYFRVRLINDTGAQSYLRLKTYYGANFVPSVAPLNQTAGLDQDAIFTRGTIAQDEIRLGRRSGVTSWNKFGYREGLTAANGEETVWATTGNYTPATTASTFTITYDGTGGGSTDGAGTTGALSLVFYYIDASGLQAVATHTLETDGSDVTSFSGLGINRIAVASSGTNDKNTSDITITHTTGGAKMAVIPAGQSVTQQAIYHVGSNSTAVVKFITFNVNKLSGSNPKVTVKGYVYNRGVDTRYEIYRHIIDTQSENTVALLDPIGFNLNATDVIYFVADTDTNNAVITFRFSLNEYQNT